jgi:hypothetical protein
MRDQIDRILYRALDVFLNGAPRPRRPRLPVPQRADL